MEESSKTNIFDLVIVAVKYNSLASALETMKNCVGPDTIIISVLNGISSEKIIGERFGMDKMLMTVAPLIASTSQVFCFSPNLLIPQQFLQCISYPKYRKKLKSAGFF